MNIRSLANLLVCTSTELAFTQLPDYKAKVDRFEAIIREYSDDAKRLDFLDKKDCKISYWNFDNTFEVYDQSKVVGSGRTVREAIDDAMEKEKP